MESKVDYTLTGLFLLLLVSGLIAFAFWLGKYNGNIDTYSYYNVYFTESVAGLAPEASVKFHGVDIGKVQSIRINPKNSEEVELVLKIRKATPIKIDSYATLKFYGITGLAYIEIEGGTQKSALLVTAKNNMATIPTSPSIIKRLDEALSNAALKLSRSLDRANLLFSDANINNVSKSLENLRSLTKHMDSYQGEIKLLLAQGISLENNASRTLQSINDTAQSATQTSQILQKNVTTTLQSVEETSKQSHALIKKIELTIDREDYNIQTIAAPTLNELNMLIEQTKVLIQEMGSSLQTLQENPSDILFKKSKPKSGPGE